MRLHSPVIRIRNGVIRGPRIGDDSSQKRASILAVGIDGSVTLIQRSVFFHALKWIQSYWSSANPTLPGPLSLFFTDSGMTYTSNANQNAINVDDIAFLANRMIPGTSTPLAELPDVLSRLFLQIVGEDDTVDLVLLVRNILSEDIDGILL
jgi:hypothetical protein